MAGITQVWGYKFGCVWSVSYRPHFALLKQGCANSGGFGARWTCLQNRFVHQIAFPPRQRFQFWGFSSDFVQFFLSLDPFWGGGQNQILRTRILWTPRLFWELFVGCNDCVPHGNYTGAVTATQRNSGYEIDRWNYLADGALPRWPFRTKSTMALRAAVFRCCRSCYFGLD